MRAESRGDTPILKVELLWTKDAGPWIDRKWETIDAQVDPAAEVATAHLPAGATT